MNTFHDPGDRSSSHQLNGSSVSNEPPGSTLDSLWVLDDRNKMSFHGPVDRTLSINLPIPKARRFSHAESLYQTRLSPATKERAINFFLSAHVLHESTYPRGYFEYLATLYSKSSTSEPLSLSLNAVALAAFANLVKSSILLNEARRGLLFAIRSVNTALHSHQAAIEDSTLSAVILLGTFETITGLGYHSVKDCDTHVNAATTLIRQVNSKSISLICPVS